jgi:Flp pilus assembly pilin Flp
VRRRQAVVAEEVGGVAEVEHAVVVAAVAVVAVVVVVVVVAAMATQVTERTRKKRSSYHSKTLSMKTKKSSSCPTMTPMTTT